MSYRLWYAQLDVYDTVRRYIAILNTWNMDWPTRDRLFVSDFYLVSPHLLHSTHMTAAARKAFLSLRIPKADQAFLKYPSPPVLYNKMSGIQNEALHNLIGRGIVDVQLVDRGQFRLSDKGLNLANELGESLVLDHEANVLTFLTTDFCKVGVEKGGLRAATGLRRIGG